MEMVGQIEYEMRDEAGLGDFHKMTEILHERRVQKPAAVALDAATALGSVTIE